MFIIHGLCTHAKTNKNHMDITETGRAKTICNHTDQKMEQAELRPFATILTKRWNRQS